MLQYPDPFAGYPMDWVDYLASFKDKETIIKLERKEIAGIVTHPGLIAYYKKLEELCCLPQIPEFPPIPQGPHTFLFMTPKKQYEIKRLGPYVYHFHQEHEIERIIDIGGGIGLLAQTIANQYNVDVDSLDVDPVLQKTGFDRYSSNQFLPKNKVNYHNIRVSADELKFNQLLGPQSLSLGLHTCGGLANDQIKASVNQKIKGIINFGCCYHKLETHEWGQNISEFAKNNSPITLARFALTLSARAHRKMDEKDYDLKQKVKYYRYAMHFLLFDRYGKKEMLTLGNTHPSLYSDSFGTYALEQFKRLEIEPLESKADLEVYFEDPKIQDLIWKMIASSLIRNSMGRLLEMLILLDRAIYLEENGYRPELLEFFQEGFSPRNIGLVAAKI